jgi:nucleoside-diphosphate-sugar epimerase
MKVLIVGCGRLGSHVARRLIADGHQVTGLRRSGRALPAGVTPMRGDAADAGTLRFPAPFDACIYAASADGRSDEAYERAYPTGVRHVLAALAESGAATGRFLFVSSTAVYGQDDGAWVDEDSETDPTAFNGRRMLEAEAAAAAGGWESCALRLAGIYGPDRATLLDRIRSGSALESGPEDRWMNHIHETDAARAVVHALALPSLPAQLCVADESPTQRGEVLGWLAQRIGVTQARHADEPQGSGSAKRVSSARLRATGFEFRYPSFRDGYGEIIS